MYLTCYFLRFVNINLEKKEIDFFKQNRISRRKYIKIKCDTDKIFFKTCLRCTP